MPVIHFTRATGAEVDVEFQPGASVMEVAVKNGLDEIIAECGGSCACATCHVYVDADWYDRFDPPDVFEADMLDFTEAERQETSRLSCQLALTADHDGLKVTLPKAE